MADVEGAKNKAHEDAQNILKSADEKADEALAGSTLEQRAKGDADVNGPTMGDKASHATETAKEKTGSAWDSTKQGTADATEKTKDATGKAWESTKQGAFDAADTTKEKTAQAKDQTGSALQTAGDKVKQAASATYDALDKANRYETYQSKE